MYCISCKKNNVIAIDFKYSKKTINGGGEYERKYDTEESIVWKKDRKPDGSLVNINNEMIDNGIIHIIDAGYGSKHDGDQFILAICDDCIKTNLEEATILYYGNYMYKYEPFVEEDISKSKKKYNRRKNLDDLV